MTNPVITPMLYAGAASVGLGTAIPAVSGGLYAGGLTFFNLPLYRALENLSSEEPVNSYRDLIFSKKFVSLLVESTVNGAVQCAKIGAKVSVVAAPYVMCAVGAYVSSVTENSDN